MVSETAGLTPSKWILDGHPLVSAPDEAFGFVYLITHMDSGKGYVGKKQFISTTHKRVAGKKRRQTVIKESDWKTYCSSCKEFQATVASEGPDAFRWTVLEICKSKRDLSYQEAKWQFMLNVLDSKFENGDARYWNRNIMNRFYSLKTIEPSRVA